MAPTTTRRTFLRGSLACGATLAAAGRLRAAVGPNDQINIGLIGCGGRGKEVAGMFHQLEGVTIAGLCDPDSSRLAEVHKTYSAAKAWPDVRRMLDDADIDAVIVATCNHWHALAAVWAMQAGKDVYVEKPLATTHWEGRQIVAAAKKYGRVCQVGTQQRSDPLQAEIKKFLHDERAIGAVKSARVNRYGVREPIGKRSTPLPIPQTVDYNLWLGPARDEPILRDSLHYDWHWAWNTGSGEMGNWGIHVLDDLRNNVFLDRVTAPSKVGACGGRVAWNDAGETPNLQMAYFEASGVPVVMGLCNLPANAGGSRAPKRPGPGSGYIAYCEGGRLEGQRGGAAAYDARGELIKRFDGADGSGNILHQANFIDAVRRRDPALLNASAEVGLHSTAWCHLANIAIQAGAPFSHQGLVRLRDASPTASELLDELAGVMVANDVASHDAIRLSTALEFDAAHDKFIGPGADEANGLLSRTFRAPFAVPNIEQDDA
jgi:predicted dehydrogenase